MKGRIVMKKLCSKCGNALGENAKFCGKCGTKYEENECQECRGSLQKGMQFCSACGKELNTEKDSSTKQFVEKSISEMSEDINQTNEQGGKKAKLPLLKIIPILIFAIVVYNVFLNPTNSPEAAVALQVAKNDMGSGFSESDIKFDVIAAKDDSKFIVKCKANSSEAEEMYELVYATDVCYYGIEFGNGVGEYFTTIGDSEADVKDKMEW